VIVIRLANIPIRCRCERRAPRIRDTATTGSACDSRYDLVTFAFPQLNRPEGTQWERGGIQPLPIGPAVPSLQGEPSSSEGVDTHGRAQIRSRLILECLLLG